MHLCALAQLQLDVSGGATRTWARPGHYCGEPLFVARPGAEAEDDGLLLVLVLAGGCWRPGGGRGGGVGGDLAAKGGASKAAARFCLRHTRTPAARSSHSPALRWPSPPLCAGQERASHLLLLDARDMSEVARAPLGHATGFGFHGNLVFPDGTSTDLG